MAVVLVLAVAGVAVLGAVGLIRGWRSALNSHYYRVPSLWPWGDAAWYAFRRTDVVGEMYVICVAVALAFPSHVDYWGFALLLLLVAGLSVFLFSRPRWLIPPPLRDQPAFVSALRSRSRGPS
jgi:hypothetical protein